ncbi:hypothetical protein GOP47_0022816 [Adiantum capillus-veneris]|uniref:Uncharacterized protein n=1 Tax=Adiantum capillus-veneris TaxID=13818 RepID=A0A9D4U775_ADICA|nr:hypothetical protein GOP47_0022816 [Adiantum capillus-veneris]
MAVAEEEGRAPFHAVHKVPAGDGVYVRAKHAQLVERMPEKAISLFWASLEAGDRVDSALKDLAIILKQQNRSHDAILAISTFRSRCSESAQDSLDNVLLDLYKSSGRLDDQIALLMRKLRAFQSSQSFNGKRTKTARSQGKKFQISVEQEVARLLGNLGWAYMQQFNFKDAESTYRQALALEVDSNKACNLGVCLMKQGKAEEAIAVLQEAASLSSNKRASSGSHLKSYERAQELMHQASTQSEVIVRDKCTIDVRMADNEDAEVMSGRVEAAYDQGDDKTATGSACEDSQESSHLRTSNMEEGTRGSLQVEPVRSGASLNSLWQSQMHAQRRLPVFQDITLLGSAAA